MNLLFYVGFNNYFNRKIKYYTLTSDYANEAEEGPYEKTFINFNPNDDVNTELVVNWDVSSTPDYMLVLNEDDDSIVSRWFVKEFVRLREGQYTATLRRDVIADNLQKLYSSDSHIFLEKGQIIDERNDLIFNKENISLNQIKTTQTPIKDTTDESWIIGYVNRSLTEDKDNISSITDADEGVYPTPTSLGITLNDPTDIKKGGTISCVSEDTEGNRVLSPTVEYGFPAPFVIVYYALAARITPLVVVPSPFEGYLRSANPLATWTNRFMIAQANTEWAEYVKNLWAQKANEYAGLYGILNDDLRTIHPEYTTYSNYLKVTGDSDLVIQHTDGKYYKVRVSSTSFTGKLEGANPSRMTTTYYALENVYQNVKAAAGSYINDSRASGYAHEIYYDEYKAIIYFEETVGPGSVRTNIKTNRRKCSDASYDIFCMRFTPDNLRLAQAIGTTLLTGNSGFIYDIQILPYCPARYLIDAYVLWKETGNEIKMLAYTEHADYERIINASSETVDFMLWCDKSSAAFSINQPIEIPNRSSNQVLNKKLSNECDMYRLSSPNMSSSFEFSVAKNGGVDYFSVTYTYKPYTPYIRITPNFKGLYGAEFKDNRGLILQGDFSIDVITDQWKQYQIQNKNYENIFNTQIKKLDDSHNISQKYAGINAGVNAAFSAAAAGAMGALGGAIAKRVGVARGIDTSGGLASSLIGIAQAEEQYSLNRQYEVDMYNYNLGNIKALPDALTKVSAYNVDNNYFPVVEYYTCSEREVEIVKNKLEFEGYTLFEFYKVEDLPSLCSKPMGQNYFKGKLVRAEVESDDHIYSELYNEFNKGVYL